MTSVRYPIPASTVRIELKIVNSRFIATIGPARDVTTAREFIATVSNEFSDATHNVYAFRVGYGNAVIEGASDDGEPSGTAGRPALAVLRGEDIGDVVIVVTRYFGGTKLGTGGLVKAYTESTQEALAALPRAERVEKRTGLIVVPYNLYEQTVRLVKLHLGEITDEDFAADVSLTLKFAIDDRAAFESALAELTAGQSFVLWEESSADDDLN